MFTKKPLLKVRLVNIKSDLDRLDYLTKIIEYVEKSGVNQNDSATDLDKTLRYAGHRAYYEKNELLTKTIVEGD